MLPSIQPAPRVKDTSYYTVSTYISKIFADFYIYQVASAGEKNPRKLLGQCTQADCLIQAFRECIVSQERVVFRECVASLKCVVSHVLSPMIVFCFVNFREYVAPGK